MIKSMTGYGKSLAETPQKKITIEIKSLNSKQLDLNTKLPWLYKEKEPEIRNYQPLLEGVKLTSQFISTSSKMKGYQ
jgi:uncharacterized protein YicC (UPF0701 family)